MWTDSTQWVGDPTGLVHWIRVVQPNTAPSLVRGMNWPGNWLIPHNDGLAEIKGEPSVDLGYVRTNVFRLRITHRWRVFNMQDTSRKRDSDEPAAHLSAPAIATTNSCTATCRPRLNVVTTAPSVAWPDDCCSASDPVRHSVDFVNDMPWFTDAWLCVRCTLTMMHPTLPFTHPNQRWGNFIQIYAVYSRYSEQYVLVEAHSRLQNLY